MRFRKLRIAWSVFWGVACVLLVVLWVRSYSILDWCYFPATGAQVFHVQSANGRAVLFIRPEQPAFRIGSIPYQKLGYPQELAHPYVGSYSATTVSIKALT